MAVQCESISDIMSLSQAGHLSTRWLWSTSLDSLPASSPYLGQDLNRKWWPLGSKVGLCCQPRRLVFLVFRWEVFLGLVTKQHWQRFFVPGVEVDLFPSVQAFTTKEIIGFTIGSVSSVLYLCSRLPQMHTNVSMIGWDGLKKSKFPFIQLLSKSMFKWCKSNK